MVEPETRPDEKTPLSQSASNDTNLGDVTRCSRFASLIRDAFLLSVKISVSMMIAAFRLVVPPNMKNLIGETVVITGTGHGIGREMALQLAALGCIVVCWDIDEQANRSTINAILDGGGEAYGYVVDVSKRIEVRETVRMMRRNKVPEVTILINNAAFLVQAPILEHNYEDIEKTFSINVLSNFWTIEAFLPTMLQNGSGHVVSICSMCGMHGVSRKVAYCSSKYAVRDKQNSRNLGHRQAPLLLDVFLSATITFILLYILTSKNL